METNQIKIKQIMPIPQGFNVLVPPGRGPSKKGTEMENMAEYGWIYVLAVMEDSKYGDHLTMYELDNTGDGAPVNDAYMLPKKYCPKCFREMKTHCEGDRPSEFWHTCSCATEQKSDKT